MPAGAVLDTSFLITLATAGRDHHQTARRYWRAFSEAGMPIYLPTIVVSEFYLRQELPPEILRACVILPFNWDDAVKAAELDFSKAPRDGLPRDALKDDVKILAQAIVKDAALVITDDTRTFYKFAQRLRETRLAQFRAIKLEDPFDQAIFDPAGQSDFTDMLEDDGDGAR